MEFSFVARGLATGEGGGEPSLHDELLEEDMLAKVLYCESEDSDTVYLQDYLHSGLALPRPWCSMLDALAGAGARRRLSRNIP